MMRFTALSVLLSFTLVSFFPADAEARRRGGGGSSKSYSSSSSSHSNYKYSSSSRRTPTSSAWYVKTATLNVRDDATESGSILRKLRKGERVTEYDTQGNWVQISADDVPAEWVSRSSLSRKKP